MIPTSQSGDLSTDKQKNTALQNEFQRQQRLLQWQQRQHEDLDPRVVPPPPAETAAAHGSVGSYPFKSQPSQSQMTMMVSSSHQFTGIPSSAPFEERGYYEAGPSILHHDQQSPYLSSHAQFADHYESHLTSTLQAPSTSWQQQQPLMTTTEAHTSQLVSPTTSEYPHTQYPPPPLPNTSANIPSGLPSSWIDPFQSSSLTVEHGRSNPPIQFPYVPMMYQGRPPSAGRASNASLGHTSGAGGMPGYIYGAMASPPSDEEARRAMMSTYPAYTGGMPHRESYSATSGTNSSSSSMSLSLGQQFPSTASSSSNIMHPPTFMQQQQHQFNVVMNMNMPPPNPPSVATTSPPEPEPQRRAATACNFCRGRKLRCDGNAPCRQCARRDLACVFSPSNLAKRKSRGSGGGGGGGEGGKEDDDGDDDSRLGKRGSGLQDRARSNSDYSLPSASSSGTVGNRGTYSWAPGRRRSDYQEQAELSSCTIVASQARKGSGTTTTTTTTTPTNTRTKRRSNASSAREPTIMRGQMAPPLRAGHEPNLYLDWCLTATFSNGNGPEVNGMHSLSSC
ncbi:hypothetical protein CBS101457_003694 [Exobasidium rhododendri]|nr:hypothetical protein CBS101457_003694 [Exobasidium rhododendri]